VVLKALLVTVLLAGQAGAACLPDGKTPRRVMFEDGQLVDAIRRKGDRLDYRALLQPGMPSQVETRWAIWPLRTRAGGSTAVFDWGTARLPAPGDLVAGREVTLAGTMAIDGAAPVPYRITVRLVGPDVVTVAGCRYDVLRLWLRMGPAGGTQVEGERWLDPGRMVIWAQTTRVIGADGRLQHEVSARAMVAD
jgi:hypothetical protein